MVNNNPTDVLAAFEILLEEIEVEITLINKAVNRATEDWDYASARNALDHVEQITAFRDKVVTLRKEWETLAGGWGDTEREEIMLAELENIEEFSHMTQRSTECKEIIHTRRRNLGRLPQGKRTPEEDFYQPILQVLVESGGSARPSDVLPKLETMMKRVLKPVDYEPIKTGEIRWHKTAHFARNSMANKKSLLNPYSPYGVWEISEAGREFLRRESR